MRRRALKSAVKLSGDIVNLSLVGNLRGKALSVITFASASHEQVAGHFTTEDEARRRQRAAPRAALWAPQRTAQRTPQRTPQPLPQ